MTRIYPKDEKREKKEEKKREEKQIDTVNIVTVILCYFPSVSIRDRERLLSVQTFVHWTLLSLHSANEGRTQFCHSEGRGEGGGRFLFREVILIKKNQEKM